MRTRLHGFLVNLMLTIPFFFISDSSGKFEELLANLEKQTYDYIQEKVYLHLDKPYYALGENLWFKAYAVAGPNHTPTPLSHNLYVELVNPEMAVLKRHTIYLNKGMGKGDFTLADSLVAGTYTVRAYTNWMRNFDEGFYFRKEIEVLDPLAAKSADTSGSVQVPTMQFFPEGGDMVVNVPTQVAFELNTSESMSGNIRASQGALVVPFKTNHEGRGKFRILPKEGEQYYAQLADGTRFDLPKVVKQGLVLSVDNLTDPDNVLVKVGTGNSTVQNEAFLVVHTGGLVSFASKLEWKGSAARVKVPRNNLTSGVVHVTLFNKDWFPEAERLIFQQQNQAAFNIELITDKSMYQPRDSTAVRLRVTDAAGVPVQGFFSMNIYDSAQVRPEAFGSHIESSLLLSSDVKGHINRPEQYFDVENAQSQRHLDLLLMTRGWSRFFWKDLLTDKFPELEHEVEQGFDIMGKVTLRESTKSASKATIKQVGVFEGLPIIAEATANSNGGFKMENLHYYAGEGTLKAKDRKGRDNVAVKLETEGEDDFTTPLEFLKTPVLYENMPSINKEYLLRSKERLEIEQAYTLDTSYTDLGEVIVEMDANEEKFRDAQRGLVFNRGEYGVNASDLMVNGQRFVNALFILQGRLPGFNIALGPAGEPNVQMSRKVWSFVNPDPPIQYYIDDAPVNLAAITALPAERVERIDVLKGMRATGLFGPSANGGAIMFYTKTQEDQEDYLRRLAENNVIMDKSTMSIQSGYYKSRQFYATSYSGALKNQVKPDRRALIHWEPMIETNEKGEAVISWFNADLETTVMINLEGIWVGGIPLRASTSYKVRK